MRSFHCWDGNLLIEIDKNLYTDLKGNHLLGNKPTTCTACVHLLYRSGRLYSSQRGGGIKQFSCWQDACRFHVWVSSSSFSLFFICAFSSVRVLSTNLNWCLCFHFPPRCFTRRRVFISRNASK